MKSLHVAAALAATVLVAEACRDDSPVAPPTPLSTLVAKGTVQTAIQQQARAADGSVTFVVRVLAKDVGVSAYQGTVTFDPGAFELVGVKTPDGPAEESHVLNSADFAAGRIRFAAFTPTTFAGTDVGDGVEAFRFTVKLVRPVEHANLEAALDVVGKETGTAVAKDQVLTSRGVRDAAGHLISK